MRGKGGAKRRRVAERPPPLRRLLYTVCGIFIVGVFLLLALAVIVSKSILLPILIFRTLLFLGKNRGRLDLEMGPLGRGVGRRGGGRPMGRPGARLAPEPGLPDETPGIALVGKRPGRRGPPARAGGCAVSGNGVGVVNDQGRSFSPSGLNARKSASLEMISASWSMQACAMRLSASFALRPRAISLDRSPPARSQ